MRIKDVIRAKKSDVTVSSWQNGAMPKSLFPLGKSGKNSLNFRGGYQWCGLKFQTLGHEFRLVVAVNFSKHEYYAHLGRVAANDTQMMVSYEYHATHGGWHIHAGCGSIDLIPVGRYKGPWKRNIPKDWHTCRQTSWDVLTVDAALLKACDFFGVKPPEYQLPLLS